VGGVFCDCFIIVFIINKNLIPIGLNHDVQCFVVFLLLSHHSACRYTESIVAPPTYGIKDLEKDRVCKMYTKYWANLRVDLNLLQ